MAAYLSQLTLDPQARAVGRALGDLYSLHQLVYSAFPDGGADGVGRVLFRLDADTSGGGVSPSLLVQSEQPPDWERLDTPAVCVRGPKLWQPQFERGQTLRFRLRASPTKKTALPRGHSQAGHQRQGLVTRPEQAAWLERQGLRCGFALRETPADWFDAFDEQEPRAAVQIVSRGHLKGHKPAGNTGSAMTLTHLAVDFDGLLRVTDPAAFAEAVRTGLGPGKAFGMGLLSLARQ